MKKTTTLEPPKNILVGLLVFATTAFWPSLTTSAQNSVIQPHTMIPVAQSSSVASSGLMPTGLMILTIAIIIISFCLITGMTIVLYRMSQEMNEKFESISTQTNTLKEVRIGIKDLNSKSDEGVRLSPELEESFKNFSRLYKKVVLIEGKMKEVLSPQEKLTDLITTLSSSIPKVNTIIEKYRGDVESKLMDEERRKKSLEKEEEQSRKNLENRQAELHKIEQELKKAKDEFESDKMDAASKLQRSAQLIEEALMIKSDAEASKLYYEEKKRILDAEQTGFEANRDLFIRRINAFWPPSFRDGGALMAYRQGIEDMSEQFHSAAPLLINTLQRVHLMKSAQNRFDPQEIAKAVQEMSRVAYRFWAESNMDDDTQFRNSKAWADATSELLGEEYKIVVVKVDEPKDALTMQYSDGTSRVVKIHTWFVGCSALRLKAHVA